MSLTLENPTLIQAAHKMESKIQFAPLYPTRLTCKITHSSSSERLCQYQRTTKASWEGWTALTQHLSALSSLAKTLAAGPSWGPRGPFASRWAPAAPLLSGPGWEPRPPGLPPRQPLLPSESFSTPITRRWLVGVGFLLLEPLPALCNVGSFQRDPRLLWRLPRRPGETPGQEGAPGWGLKETGTQSQAWPHSRPTSPLQSSLRSGLDLAVAHPGFSPRSHPRAAPSPKSAPQSDWQRRTPSPPGPCARCRPEREQGPRVDSSLSILRL